MKPARALFVGNSYTHCNNLPGMVAQLAASAPRPRQLDTEMVTAGGVTLEWHCENSATLEAIRRGGWDLVVLQEQSLRPVQNKEKMHEFGAKLGNEIEAQGAKPVLYLTWARQHKPEMQSGLTEAYLSLAEKIDAMVAPVGIAWQKAFAENPELVLHTEDQSHPNPQGSYLAACVFYAAFFQLSPAGLPGAVTIDGKPVINLDRQQASFLQSVAWQAAQDAM